MVLQTSVLYNLPNKDLEDKLEYLHLFFADIHYSECLNNDIQYNDTEYKGLMCDT
jgi:hypothetical protein